MEVVSGCVEGAVAENGVIYLGYDFHRCSRTDCGPEGTPLPRRRIARLHIWGVPISHARGLRPLPAGTGSSSADDVLHAL